jgi:hypothetical protein
MIGIQILGLLFGLFSLYWTFLNWKREEFSAKETIVWIAIWILFIIVILLPKSMEFIVTDIFSVSTVIDFFIIMGIMFLMIITYYNYTAIRRQQKRVEKLVRELALKRSK